jgi:hypothetical protein
MTIKEEKQKSEKSSEGETEWTTLNGMINK